MSHASLQKMINHDVGVQHKVPPELAIGSPGLLIWTHEEVSERLKEKQAMLQECTEPLAASEAGSCSFLGTEAARRMHNLSRQSLRGATCARARQSRRWLRVNSSSVTAVANDNGYDEVFAGQIVAFDTKNDAAISISTSGNSQVSYSELPRYTTLKCLLSFTGGTGGQLRSAVDLCLAVPSTATARHRHRA